MSLNNEDSFINNHSPIEMDISTSAEPPNEEPKIHRFFDEKGKVRPDFQFLKMWVKFKCKKELLNMQEDWVLIA